MHGRVSKQKWEQLARDGDFNSAKMASLCAISERQLQRIFRRDFDSTPSHWLRELQCRLAKDLIAQGYSNKAAATELKFASQSHFCREFKRVFGASPQTFAPAYGFKVKIAPPNNTAARGQSGA